MKANKLSNKLWVVTVLILAVIIIVLSVILLRSNSSLPVDAAPSVPPPSGNIPLSPDSTNAGAPTPLSQSVVVTSPTAGAIVPKVISVSGSAPGGWFFEAQFPMQIRDQANVVVGHGTGHALGNWQTTALVAFTGTTTVETNYTGPATLVLLKDNPSGLPENDDSISLPVIIQ